MPTLLEEQTDPSLLRRLGSASLSGVAGLGNILDLPGSAVRDVLAFKNPLDQFLPWNWTSSENRTSGRDLLRQYGAIGKEDTTPNFFGGLALEAILDPTTYVGIGALTKAGKAAQAAGALGDVAKTAARSGLKTTLPELAAAGSKASEIAAQIPTSGLSRAQVATQPLRNLVNVGVPFTSLQKGYTAGEVAGGLDSLLGAGRGTAAVDATLGGLDYASSALASSPLGRATKMLFDPASGGVMDETGQKLAEGIYDTDKAAQRSVRELTKQTADSINEQRQAFQSIYGPDIQPIADKAHPGVPKIADDLTNHFFDRLLSLTRDFGGDVDRAMKEISLPAGKLTPELRSGVEKVAKSMEKASASYWDEYRNLGGVGESMEALGATATDPAIVHAERYASGGGLFDRLKRLVTRTGSSFARADEIRHLPKDVVNRLTIDQAARGKHGAAHIETAYSDFLGRGEKLDPATGNKVPRWANKAEHAAALADWVDRREKFPIFNNTTLEDFYTYATQAQTAITNLKASHNLLADSISPTGRVPVSEVLKKANMDQGRSANHLAALLTKKTGKTVNPADVLGMKVDEDVARAIAGVRKAHDNPEWFNVIGGAMDEVTNFWKQNVTLPFPAYHSRNLLGGQFINLATGFVESPQDIKSYVDSVKEAWQMIRTLDPKQLSEMFVNGVIDQRMLGEGVEMAGGKPWSFGEVRDAANVKRTWQETAAEVAARPTTTSTNPVAAAAGAAADKARTIYGTALHTGEKTGGLAEFMNRAPMYLYLKKKGFDPAAAAAKTMELHIDYADMTPFEKNVMRRVIPFYSFTRKIAPVILGTLASNPSGPMGQLIRASRLAGGDPGTPDWLQDTLAIPNPLGSQEDGGRSYITGFGLPYEPVAAYFGGGLRGAGREFLSGLNPLIKAPLEWSTGQSFFQTGADGSGRPLDELDPLIGRTVSNALGMEQPVPMPDIVEFAAANSPVARLLTSARQLTDPRKSVVDKAANLLTGARVTNVSPSSVERSIGSRADALLKSLGGRKIEKTFIPKDANLSEADRGLVEKLQELRRLLDQQKRARQQ